MRACILFSYRTPIECWQAYCPDCKFPAIFCRILEIMIMRLLVQQPLCIMLLTFLPSDTASFFSRLLAIRPNCKACTGLPVPLEASVLDMPMFTTIMPMANKIPITVTIMFMTTLSNKISIVFSLIMMFVPWAKVVDAHQKKMFTMIQIIIHMMIISMLEMLTTVIVILEVTLL